MLTIAELKRSFLRPGRVEWIGIASERRGEIRSVDEAEVQVGTGLVGEHHARRGRSKRQVTFIQAEHLPVIAGVLDRDSVGPEELRRNVLVSGINLLALKDQRFRIGSAIFQGTGPCDPCSRMEETFGPGGYNAVRGHGGITTRVLRAGTIEVGTPVEWLSEEAWNQIVAEEEAETEPSESAS